MYDYIVQDQAFVKKERERNKKEEIGTNEFTFSHLFFFFYFMTRHIDLIYAKEKVSLNIDS